MINKISNTENKTWSLENYNFYHKKILLDYILEVQPNYEHIKLDCLDSKTCPSYGEGLRVRKTNSKKSAIEFRVTDKLTRAVLMN